MTGLATIRTCLEQCYDAIESLAGRMDATSWHAQSLCPDWDMRGVIAHLAMMERVMTGWLTEADLVRQSWTPVGPRSYGGFVLQGMRVVANSERKLVCARPRTGRR